MNTPTVSPVKGLVALLLAMLGACKFPELPPLEADAPALDAAATDGVPARYTLTLTVDSAGTGAGSITVEPGTFTCSTGTCMQTYDAGTVLTVTATGGSPLDGLVSVVGDCQASPCTLPSLDGDRSVTARFVRYACAPSTATCSSNAYTECDSTGNFVTHVIPNGALDGSPVTITMNNYACPMGCHATAPRCADITLGNGIEVALDTPAVSPTGQDIVLPGPSAPAGTITFETGSFNTSTGLLRVTDTDGAAIDLPGQIVEQGGEAGAVLVIKTRTFTLRSGSVLRANGTRSLGIVSHFGTYIAGAVDASGGWSGSSRSGPGVRGFGASCTGGSIATFPGATGGAGAACTGGSSSAGTPGGAVTAVLAPAIVGGCTGGKGTGLIEIPSLPGGGLFFASRTRIYLAATAVVDLTGSGGVAGVGYARGGASGGNTVLMAPLVRVVSGAAIVARGGGGGAASPSGGTYGSDGPVTGSSPAPGATCSGCGTGGVGGYEASCTGGSGTGSGSAIAAGGGATGHCAIYSLTGAADVSVGTAKCVRLSEPLLPRSP